MQVERTLAVPVEIALVGMPALRSISSTSTEGGVQIVLVWESNPGTNHTPEVHARLENAEIPLPLASRKPVLRELASFPKLEDGPLTPYLRLEPDAKALEARGLTGIQFWSAVATACDRSDSLEEQEQHAAAAQIVTSQGNTPLSDVSKIERIAEPAAISRHQGFRLSSLPAGMKTP